MRKMSNKKIVIVDDDKDFLEELQTAIALMDYKLISIDDGNAALKASTCDKSRCDIAWYKRDIKMKGLYGFQIAERLKGSPETVNIIIIIIGMSGCFTREQDVKITDLCGMKIYFKKPINPNCLIETIDMLMKEKRHNGEGVKELYE